MSMRESLVIEQYVSGLINPELKCHVLFSHPSTFDRAISLAVEFEVFENSHKSQLRKPRPEGNTTHVFAVNGSQQLTSTTQDTRIAELAESVRLIQESYAELTRAEKQQHSFRAISNRRPGTRNRNNDACYTCNEIGHFTFHLSQ